MRSGRWGCAGVPLPGSGEQDRREPPAPIDGRFVGGPPGLEELDQLLARSVILPFAVALDDLDQIVDRFRAPPLAVEGNGEIEAGLMVERVGGDLLLQL